MQAAGRAGVDVEDHGAAVRLVPELDVGEVADAELLDQAAGRLQVAGVDGEAAAAPLLGAADGGQQSPVLVGEAVHGHLGAVQVRHHQQVGGGGGGAQRGQHLVELDPGVDVPGEPAEGERLAGEDPEALAADAARGLQAGLRAGGLDLLDGEQQLGGGVGVPPQRGGQAGRVEGAVALGLAVEQGYRGRRRADQRGAEGLELAAAQRDRQLVEAGQEHVHVVAGAELQREFHVALGGEPVRFQQSEVGGGEHRRIGVGVGRQDVHRARGGPQQLDEEDVLGVGAVEPDADGRGHGRSPWRRACRWEVTDRFACAVAAVTMR